jgi:hypothetical protein
MLRHRESKLAVNPLNRDRYHAKLRRLVRSVRIPTRAKELADPIAADQVYDACVAYLRNATRDRAKYGLIFEENINYGFRRNLWGMRASGIFLAAIGVAASGIVAASAWTRNDPLWGIASLIATGNACLLSWWMIRIRPPWVLTAARAYAERLLEACDSL